MYKQIESLDEEEEYASYRIEGLIEESEEYSSQYDLVFDQNEIAIANSFYGHNRWQRKTIIKKSITLN